MSKLSQTVIYVFAIQLLLLFIYQRLRDKGDFNYLNNNNDNLFMDELGLGDVKKNDNLTVDGTKNEGNGTKSPVEVCRDKNMKGPITNFHQMFNINNNQGKMNELGWRKHFLRYNSKNMIEPDSNFRGSGLETYLHNLDNNRNVYL
jgi:hypothetical protein